MDNLRYLNETFQIRLYNGTVLTFQKLDNVANAIEKREEELHKERVAIKKLTVSRDSENCDEIPF